MDRAVFIFTPSHKQQQYLEFVFDSIAKYISIPYQFCLFTDKLNENFTSKYNLEIKIITKEDLELLENNYYPEKRSDIPAFSAYAQFLLPRYFSNYDAFIYMEVDQIVRGDLANLWKDCVKNNYPLAASVFLDDDFTQTSVDSFNKIHPGAKCFNTGVLYVDVKFWIKHEFENRCLREIAIQKVSGGSRLDFYAQGAINNSLHLFIYEIPWVYNTPGFGSVRGISSNIIDSAIILHWTGPMKPWVQNGLYKDLFYFDDNLKNINDYVVTFRIQKLIFFKLKRLIRNILKKFQYSC
jgi:lipopolysaccharide biosynthesis glycosyltransferase